MSFCVLFCPVWMLSLGGLCFSEEETEGLGESRGGGGLGGVKRKETDLDERRNYF